eukprot:s1289_g9.t1
MWQQLDRHPSSHSAATLARSAETSLADQINQMFEQDAIMEATHEKKLEDIMDAIMEATHEKKLEDIMVHFDCAVRLALGENNCTLELLFPGAGFWSERGGLPNIIVISTQNVLHHWSVSSPSQM